MDAVVTMCAPEHLLLNTHGFCMLVKQPDQPRETCFSPNGFNQNKVIRATTESNHFTVGPFINKDLINVL